MLLFFFFYFGLVSLLQVMCLLQDYSVYLSDGLHLSEKGNQFVARHLWKLLERRLAQLPFMLPYWADVDPKNPESSLLSGS